MTIDFNVIYPFCLTNCHINNLTYNTSKSNDNQLSYFGWNSRVAAQAKVHFNENRKKKTYLKTFKGIQIIIWKHFALG